MSEFKVGDRVVFLSADGVGHSLAKFGDRGVVLRVSDDLVLVKTDRGPTISAWASRFVTESQAEAMFATTPPAVKEASALVKLDTMIEAQKAEIADAKAKYRAAQRKLSQIQAAKTLIEGL